MLPARRKEGAEGSGPKLIYRCVPRIQSALAKLCNTALHTSSFKRSNCFSVLRDCYLASSVIRAEVADF